MSIAARRLQRAAGSITDFVRPGSQAGVNPNASWALPGSNYVVWDPTNGNNANDGTVANPVKSLSTALTKITSGGTVVVRGGIHSGTEVGYKIASAASYNASLGYAGIMVTKACTIQPYPGEHPVFDGTRDESGGWTFSSGRWSKAISIVIDRSPTDQYGQLDNNNTLGWKWVRDQAWHDMYVASGGSGPATDMYPLAAWNEQVWIDDEPLEQVATLGEVTTGKFYVAGTAGGTNNMIFTSSTYYLGSDPTGKEVRVGELCTSLRLNVANSTLRGITFRRFCSSNHMGGVIKGAVPNSTFEDVKIEWCPAVGFELFGPADNSTYTRCEAYYIGNTGYKFSNSSYNLTYDKCKATYCNYRRYNESPVSGGVKGVVGRNVIFKDGAFNYNFTKGLWFDVSNYDVNIISCDLSWNEQYGATFEIGAKALMANCLVTHNGSHGIVVLNNHDLRIWNCTFSGNGRLKGQVADSSNPRNLKVYSDDRRLVDSPPGGPGEGEYPGYGRDSRQPLPDPTMNNWLIEAFEMKNCVLAPGGNGSGSLQFAYLPIEDLQKNSNRSRDWTEYNIASNGNLFNRLATNNPSWAFLLPGWGTAQTILLGSSALSQWRTTTSQDASSVEVVAASVCAADGKLTAPNLALYGRGGSQCPAVALPADVAAAIGVPTGDRHVGAYL